MENEERENTRDVGESGDMVERERGERGDLHDVEEDGEMDERREGCDDIK